MTVNGKEMTGGLVGKNGGTITKSSSGGTVKGDTITGGLVGDSSGDIAMLDFADEGFYKPFR